MLYKAADFAGGGDDLQFEKSFANLAHAYIRGKAPSLTKYELGFQIIDQTDDRTRAVGIIGYKLGNLFASIPVFFDNGQLKGDELLYLSKADIFVPVEQNWVNYLLNRQVDSLGSSETRSLGTLGIMPPDLEPFRGPVTKRAQAADWLRPSLPGIANASMPSSLLESIRNYEITLPSVVSNHKKAAACLIKLCDSSPKLALKIAEYYGAGLIRDAVDLARQPDSVLSQIDKKASAPLTGSVLAKDEPHLNDQVEIFVFKPGVKPDGLSEKEAQELKRKGVYIRDRRDNRSKLYTVQESLSLENPTDTSVYQVLLSPDNFKECLVIVKPMSSLGSASGSVVISLADSDSHKWSHTDTGSVWVGGRDDKKFQRWVSKKPAAKSLEVDGVYVLVAPNGQGTMPFTVVGESAGVDKERTYRIQWRGDPKRNDWMYAKQRPTPIYRADIATSFYQPNLRGQRNESGETQLVSGTRGIISLGRIKGNKFLLRGRTMYAPPGTVAVKLIKKDSETEFVTDDVPHGDDFMLFGTPAELQYMLYKSAESLKLYADDYDVWVNDRRMSRKAGLIHLVRDFGLSEKTAKLAIQKADKERGARFLLKRAAGGYLSEGPGPVSPVIPGDVMPAGDNVMNAQYPVTQSDTMTLPYSMPPGKELQRINEPPQQLISQLQSAANTGQREVMDTSMLAALTELSGDRAIIDDSIGPMMKGLNAVGRTLFNMYWHRNLFEDRFGPKDLAELEDGLRSTFNQLGKVVLKLKQRSVDTFDLDDVEVEPSDSVESLPEL